MKLLLCAVISCGTFVPQTICQEEQKHLTARTGGASINFAADTIQRQDSPTPQPSPYASVVQLNGNVRIRTCCVQTPAGKGKVLRQLIIMRADEADYDEDTSEIEVRGNVRINFQNYPNSQKATYR